MTSEPPPNARLSDVAALAGVSKTTASLIMNDKVDSFPPETVDRVRRAATDLGYRPNHMARSLRQQRSQTIGMLSDEIAITPFAGAMIRGAQEAAWKSGRVLVLMDTEGDAEVEQAGIEAFRERQVDGVLYAFMRHLVVEVPPLLRSLNVVLLNGRSSDETMPSVAPAEVGGSRAAIEHLLAAGHTRIGFVQSPDPLPAAVERLIGYRSALRDAGIDYDRSLVVPDALEGSGPTAEVRGLLARSDRPSAVFCFNDRMALGVYNEARRQGLSIPDDLSIVGFDNMEPAASWLDPPLTTVQLPHYEMGRLAVETLDRLITGEEEENHHYRVECPLVERASVAPPPG